MIPLSHTKMAIVDVKQKLREIKPFRSKLYMRTDRASYTHTNFLQMICYVSSCKLLYLFDIVGVHETILPCFSDGVKLAVGVVVFTSLVVSLGKTPSVFINGGVRAGRHAAVYTAQYARGNRVLNLGRSSESLRL